MKFYQALLLLPFVVVTTQATADTYPKKTITLVVGFPPGGGADGVVRQMSEAMSRQLGQAVIVDYRPGAGTTISSAHVAKSVPDGYTLYMNSGTHYGADKVLYKKSVQYSGKDFTAIARWTRTPLILAVSKNSGINSIADLVAKAKAKPDEITYASSGSGVAPHLAAVLFQKTTGTKMTHVPYKGGAAAVNAVASGDVNITFGTPPSILPLAQAGRVKMIAVTSFERAPTFPNLPTIAEAGYKEFDYTYWFGLYGPAGIPKDVVRTLVDASSKALADSGLQQRLAAGGNDASPTSSADEFQTWVNIEGRRQKELMEQSGASVD